jgi:hypothetical protein
MASLLHQVVEGERWDQIAYRYYGDALKYGRLIEANTHLDLSTTLHGGMVLVVPLIDATNESSTVLAGLDVPPWDR